MRLFVVVVILVGAILPRVYAQNLELGLKAGIINYQGDLADGYIVLSETKPSFGIHLRHFINNRASVSFNYWYGNLTGKDANSKSQSLRIRNFSFSSTLQEITVNGEWALTNVKVGGTGLFKASLVPYLSVGAGVAFAPGKPKAPVNALEDPFPELGDRDNFFSLPIIGGLRWNVAPNTIINFEMGSRMIFSDYLDGVSINGNPNRNDWYIISAVGVSYYFKTDRVLCGSW